MFRKINWDALGITTSILCAIHCAILPLAVATLPVFGVNIVHNQLFENGMIGIAFIIGTWALWHGFRLHHHRLTPWLIFLTGMILLIAKQIWHSQELFILPAAVLCIVAAHVLNFRWSKQHGIGTGSLDLAGADGGGSGGCGAEAGSGGSGGYGSGAGAGGRLAGSGDNGSRAGMERDAA